jgi:hypothetical protein
MDPQEVKREAKRLLKELLHPVDPLPRVHCEYVRCIICDRLVSIAEADFVYDETGQFYGWECEIHI